MTTPNLTPIQRHFLYLFSTGATFPNAALALAIDAGTLKKWRQEPEFAAAHIRACHAHSRHQCDLAQIEEIRTYLNNPKPEIGPAGRPLCKV